MKTAFSWKSTPTLLLAIVVWANESESSAQLPSELPEPEVGSQLPPPAEPDPQEEPMETSAPAYLGITFEPLARDAAVVRSVTPDGPADHAGLQPGDTIEAINGNRVDSNRDVLDLVIAMRPGDIIDIDFSRRITGRTQAVIEGGPEDRPRTAYAERDTVVAEQADRASYEELPTPAYSQRRVERTTPRDDLAPRPRESYDERADRRDESPRRGSLFDRDRSYRSRPLLPRRRD